MVIIDHGTAYAMLIVSVPSFSCYKHHIRIVSPNLTLVYLKRESLIYLKELLKNVYLMCEVSSANI